MFKKISAGMKVLRKRHADFSFQKKIANKAKKDSHTRAELFASGIPKKVRKRGVVLHPGTLEKGDLILVSRKPPQLLSKWIIKVQEQHHAYKDAIWHHAMVSNGGIAIIEAFAFKPVALKPYWKYLGGEYDICVRRVRNLNQVKRAKIVDKAQEQIGRSYGWMSIISIFLVAHGFRLNLRPSAGVICSQLYADACQEEGIELFEYNDGNKVPPTPANLHACAQLETIKFEWLDLQPKEPYPEQPRFSGWVPFWKRKLTK